MSVPCKETLHEGYGVLFKPWVSFGKRVWCHLGPKILYERVFTSVTQKFFCFQYIIQNKCYRTYMYCKKFFGVKYVYVWCWCHSLGQWAPVLAFFLYFGLYLRRLPDVCDQDVCDPDVFDPDICDLDIVTTFLWPRRLWPGRLWPY